MDNLNTLITQYWAGKLSASNKLQLVELLEEKITDLSDDEYQAFNALVNEKQTLLNRQDRELTQVFKAIQHQIKPKQRFTWMWAAAAAVAVLVITAWWITRPYQQPVLVAMEHNISTDIASNKDITLPDGSTIHIYPGTQLNIKDRQIKMDGKALFQVVTDPAHPFIVYAGGFATKVLGTTFEINTQQKGRFSASLLKGKIVVQTADHVLRPMQDIYLSPNEKFVYDVQQKTFTLDSVNRKPIVKEAAPELAFTKLPLPVVFKILEQEYHIVIECDEGKVSGIIYSGTFNKSASAFSILKKISGQYSLKLSKEAGIYKIE
jgi:transmembrane sensor